jgi:predicted regulator of Ras-like GTPase activity (Roadblock/LC7/MglB family)
MTPLAKHEKAACEEVLVGLVGTSAGIEAALLASSDGFEVVSAARGARPDGPRLAAMASSLLALGTAVAHDLALDGCRNIHIEAGGGVVLLVTVPCARTGLVLSAVAHKGATLGMVLVATRNCAQSIARLLDAEVPAGRDVYAALVP